MIRIQSEQIKLKKQYYITRLNGVLKQLKLTGIVTVKLGDEEESRELNNTYRKKDYPTDVLSFPLNEKLPGGFYIGDIFICHPIAVKQAEENGVSIEEELLTLMVHGILHLAGYDHEEDDGEMLDLQDTLLDAIEM